MASGNNSAEKQLAALHRLEFYKNKRNWKLYERSCSKEKPPPSPKSTNKLNKTYNVGEESPEAEFDGDSPHNKAFLHEASDDTPDPQPPDSLSQSAAVPGHNLYRPHSWPGQPCSGVMTEPLWYDAQQEWCGAEAEGTPAELAYDQCDGAWQPQDLWAPVSDFPLNPGVQPLSLPAEYLTPAQVLSRAENWLLQRGCPLLWGDYEENGLDETVDFVRGAHQAPHSSEIDLSITQECPCSCKDTVREWSLRQLARGVQRHHLALRLLLKEQALRNRLSALSRRLPPLPFEECPSRDTDPLRPSDVLLAGSNFPPDTGTTGRGRGRLQQARMARSNRP